MRVRTIFIGAPQQGHAIGARCFAGNPLVGDERYGAAGDPLRRIALHATTLAFTHPSSGERRQFTSPPPERFWTLVGRRDAPPAATAGERPASRQSG